jgi:hypoxanthine phosphoribosyltransferase
MMNDFKKILISKEEIEKITKKMGEQITKDYQGKELVIVGMLKGGIPFMMDLIKHIDLPLVIDFMQISSFHGGRVATNLVFKKDIETNVAGKHVIIVDDIIDSARTIVEVFKLFETRKVASIEAACLLDKPAGRLVEFTPKYFCTYVPNEFVVGYGLDYNEYYRNLPFIAVLKDEIYND